MLSLREDDLERALQENLKLRRELATGLTGAKFTAARYRWAGIVDALRYALFGRTKKASLSTAVGELMTLDGARAQYAAKLRQLDKPALVNEIEQLRRVIADLVPRDKSARHSSQPDNPRVQERDNVIDWQRPRRA